MFELDIKTVFLKLAAKQKHHKDLQTSFDVVAQNNYCFDLEIQHISKVTS